MAISYTDQKNRRLMASTPSGKTPLYELYRDKSIFDLKNEHLSTFGLSIEERKNLMQLGTTMRQTTEHGTEYFAPWKYFELDDDDSNKSNDDELDAIKHATSNKMKSNMDKIIAESLAEARGQIPAKGIFGNASLLQETVQTTASSLNHETSIVFLNGRVNKLEEKLGSALKNIDTKQLHIDSLEQTCASHLEAISILAKSLDDMQQQINQLTILEPLEDL